MNLTEEQAKQLLNQTDQYQCELVKQRFAYDFYQDHTSPLGSILIFEYPTLIGNLLFNRALNICVELPNYNITAGVCFERLFLTQIGSILAETLSDHCFVNENSLLINSKQSSITFLNVVNNSLLLQVTLPLKGSSELFYYLNSVSKEVCEKIDNSFHFLTKSLFFETQYNNL